MSRKTVCKFFVLLFAAILCIDVCGKQFFPSGVSNRSKDRISVARSDGKIIIRIKDYHEWDGQAVLPHFDLIHNKDYEFSCRVSSPEIKCFYIQAFLIKGKNKIRIESEENSSLDERVVLRFNSIDFDRIEIALRNRCPENCINKCFTISEFYFGDVQKDSHEVRERMKIVPQFNSAGIYLNNNISSKPSKFSAKLFFKRADEKEFHPALPASYDWINKVMRASFVMLDEDTEYLFYIDVNDSGKKERIEGKFRTRSSKFPVKETIVLDEIPSEFKSGTPDKYILYTSKHGTILDGKNDRRAAVDLENKKYIILDSLEIKGGRIEGINLKNAENIVIRNCNIYGFGRTGTHRPDIDGRYYEKNYSINNDCGIRIFNSRRITVENCVIHSPRGNANSWFYSHPSGPNGIHAGDSREIVLRGNDIFGSTFHRWNDAVESKGNGKISGGIGSDAEIYSNYFAVCNDDGMELDGGQKNVRFIFNKSEDTLCGVSAAPCLTGPSYIMHNLFCGKGDEYFYKASGIKNNYSVSGTGTLYFVGNTILDYYDGIGGFTIRKDEKIKMKYPFLKVYGRNNLVRTTGPLYSRGVFKKEFICDVDGDKMIQEYKAENILLPLRNTSFHLDKVNLKMDLHDGNTKKTFLNITAIEDCSINIVKGADFFNVIPAEFKLKAGESRKIEVVSVPEKMNIPARFVSAFSIRQNNGVSRPVLVECITWNNPELVQKTRKNSINAKITPVSSDSFKAEFEINSPGNYYLFVKHKDLKKICYASVSVNGGKFERKMIRPPAGFKNSWCIISAPTYDGKPNRPLKFKSGKQYIIIKGISSDDIAESVLTPFPDAYRLSPCK